MTSLSPVLAVIFGLAALSGSDGVKVEKLDIPLAVRNGSGPVDLVCLYSIENDERGLIVMWNHDGDRIYRWIPPLQPEDFGVIQGSTVYPLENLNRPESRSIIRLKKVSPEMSGGYTCSVFTSLGASSSDLNTMMVYVPEESLTVQASDFNETHVNFSCLATGARPRPELTIIVESIVLKNNDIHVDDEYSNNPRMTLSSVARKTTEPVVVECEIQIPGTGYGRREKLVYYPSGGLQNPTVEYINGTTSVETKKMSTTESIPVSREVNSLPTVLPPVTSKNDESISTIEKIDSPSTVPSVIAKKSEDDNFASFTGSSSNLEPLATLVPVPANVNEENSSNLVINGTFLASDKNDKNNSDLGTIVVPGEFQALTTIVTSSTNEKEETNSEAINGTSMKNQSSTLSNKSTELEPETSSTQNPI